MFIFFFGPPAPPAHTSKYRPGVVCKIIHNDLRHETMPTLYPDRIGQEVMITEAATDPAGWVWGYEIQIGRRPSSTQPFRTDWLKPLNAQQTARVLRLAK
ncbi:hypothetical protein A8L34_22405 [Bacillus sp. FJAT-27264]|nr:hypothetical protein A8L34_22405 [Bacillus sp. FJAT-27264]